MSKEYALISVSDKDGLVPVAEKLVAAGVEILSTGGTAKALEDAGIAVTHVSDYTGHPEILGGRVKTLHPKVHGGILARRSVTSDTAELTENEISPINYVLVNLYPFRSKLQELSAGRDSETESELIEFIDIGGPTLLRASAKNFNDVIVVTEPEDYSRLEQHLSGEQQFSLAERRKLAAKVFSKTAQYDASIAKYLSGFEEDEDTALSSQEVLFLERAQELRYGENPHQVAGYYRSSGSLNRPWVQLQGKELSYNNLLDMSAAVELSLDLQAVSSKSKAVVIKHLNPCGVASGDTIAQAFSRARSCDSISAFGGIVCVNGEVDLTSAETMLEGFLEVIVAERFTSDALQAFKRKKNTRLIQCDFKQIVFEKVQMRNIFDGVLLQDRDSEVVKVHTANLVSGEALNEQELDSAAIAQVVCKHVKSNAIVLAKDGMAIGIGAGQMSRIDSARLAVERARKFGFDIQGAVAASDAFLPFADTLESLASAGASVLIQPGGSIRDEEVIEAAKQANVKMLFTGIRHFRH